MNTLSDKALARGVASLSDEELLSLLLGVECGGGSGRDLSAAVLDACRGSLATLASCDVSRLRMIAGMGLRRAERLKAAVELGRRVAAERSRDVVDIASGDDVERLMRPLVDALPYEECWALYLTSSNRVIERMRVSQGGVQATVVDHRLIVKRALELLSTQIILVHNHPSGAAEASEQDRHLTRRVADACRLFDIKLLDHIVIARSGDSYSFRSHSLL